MVFSGVFFCLLSLDSSIFYVDYRGCMGLEVCGGF